MSKMIMTTMCRKHGLVEWHGRAFRCSKCSALFSEKEISKMAPGEECPVCSRVLLPVPWRPKESHTIAPACEKCLEEKTEKECAAKTQIVIEAMQHRVVRNALRQLFKPARN